MTGKHSEVKKKLKVIVSILLLPAILWSCREQQQDRQAVVSRAKVKLSTIEYGYIPDYIELSGKTVYLNKSNLRAPISGYVNKVNARPGDQVQRGTLLFELKTPEEYLIRSEDTLLNADYGTIKVYAPVTGRIISMNIMNKGEFADKGSVLAVLLSSGNLKVQVNVPYEYNRWANPGDECKIILPDSTDITGRLSKYLPQVNESSQTVKLLADINTKRFLPENMIVKVLIDKGTKQQTQILPKSCLQTDALMKRFWVMKLINDSTAVRVEVRTGNTNHDRFQVLSPQFMSTDRFISEGGYGLGDTALITIAE